MAKAYLELFIVRSDEYKEQYITEMLRKFRINGIIYHDAKTCPCNSDEQTKTNIEAFIEQLEEGK
jgi:benzoyl-CoA reductase/2-hydroxyglutaryl-CoA dehydratase subunit BcrC/BadD/HgdB